MCWLQCLSYSVWCVRFTDVTLHQSCHWGEEERNVLIGEEGWLRNVKKYEEDCWRDLYAQTGSLANEMQEVTFARPRLKNNSEIFSLCWAGSAKIVLRFVRESFTSCFLPLPWWTDAVLVLKHWFLWDFQRLQFMLPPLAAWLKMSDSSCSSALCFSLLLKPFNLLHLTEMTIRPQGWS